MLPARVNQHVAIIRTKRELLLPKFLVLILTSSEVKRFLNDLAGTGSTRQALTKSHLEALRIPVPTLLNQLEIVEKAEAFDGAISKTELVFKNAKLLRAGLLSDLLSGNHEIPPTYDKIMGAA